LIDLNRWAQAVLCVYGLHSNNIVWQLVCNKRKHEHFNFPGTIS